MSYMDDVIRIDDEYSDSDLEDIFEMCFPDEKIGLGKRSGSSNGPAESSGHPSIICVLCDCCDNTEHFSEQAESLKRDEAYLAETVVIEDSDDEGVATALSSSSERLSFAIDDICKAVFDRIDLNSRVENSSGLFDRSSAVLNEIKALQNDVKDIDVGLHLSMQSLYETYRPSTIQLPPVEFVDGPFSLNYRIDGLARMNGNPSSYNTPKVGDKFLFETDSTNIHGEWVPGTIGQVLNVLVGTEYEKRYVMKVENQIHNQIVVNASQLAYFDAYDKKLYIGARIVAVHPNNVEKGYCSGMVAELPSQTNKCRYLVFYSCGSSLYVLPHNIRQVLECKKEPHEYFNRESQKFIKRYLSSFPERLMLEVKLQDVIKTSFKGAWYNAKVIDVDASLVKIFFFDHDYSEWLYRGSTRFFPVLVKNNIQERPNRKITYRGTTLRANSRSCIQYEVVLSDEDYNSASDSNFNSNTEKSNCNTVRVIGRKKNDEGNNTRHTQSKRRSTRLDSGRVVTKYPEGILNPRINTPHTCSHNCVNWLSCNKEETIGMNPLAIPSVFAFKRKVEGVSVTYISPCGKKLSNYDEILFYISDTNLQLSIDVFDFDPKLSIFDEFVVAPEYVLFKDVSQGSESVPIPCINIYDHNIPDLMEYMTERRGLEGVKLNVNPDFLFGCDCTDNCSDKSKCACWQQTVKQAREFDFSIDPDKIGYKYKRLPEMLLTGIYECNSTCKCKNTCLNRVVQHPVQLKLQLFKTKKKGWGTRCVNDIAAGTFICLYVGNILNEQQANTTGKAYGDEYFAELDYIDVLENHKDNFEEFPPELEELQIQDKSDLKKLEGKSSNNDAVSVDCIQNNPKKFPSVRSYYGPNESVYIMDTKNAGNIGRFLNHSCDPNTFVQNVFVDTHDLRFPWVSFFALKYIPAGTELTWNYGYDVDSVPGKKIYCFCEAPNCRKRLL